MWLRKANRFHSDPRTSSGRGPDSGAPLRHGEQRDHVPGHDPREDRGVEGSGAVPRLEEGDPDSTVAALAGGAAAAGEGSPGLQGGAAAFPGQAGAIRQSAHRYGGLPNLPFSSYYASTSRSTLPTISVHGPAHDTFLHLKENRTRRPRWTAGARRASRARPAGAT